MSTELSKERIVWVDVETTGLDPFSGDELLQVACRITDGNLEFLDGDGFEGKVYFPKDEVEQLRETSNEFVRNMHEETGLWKALPNGAPLDLLEDMLLTHIKNYVPEKRVARLGGNSITLDRNFLTAFMPEVAAHLHYRSYDVSTVLGLVNMYMGPEGDYETPAGTKHEAMFDITNSVNQLRHCRELLFSKPKEPRYVIGTLTTQIGDFEVEADVEGVVGETRYVKTI